MILRIAACAAGCAMVSMAFAAAAAAAAAAAGANAGATARAASAEPFYTDSFANAPPISAMVDIGRALFFDTSLSASSKLACATCHSPEHGFGPSNGLPVEAGGTDAKRSGVRAVPSLMYTQNVPPFTEHYFDDEGDDSVDQGPAGGRTWDGRAQSAHDQARLPLFSPFEMANASADAVVAKAQNAGYAAEIRRAFGERIFDDKALAFKALQMSLEVFQQSPADFYPYSSKYDAWLRHETALSAAELRGMDAYNDPAKGNCSRCHPGTARGGASPQFTDFGYAALGAPRNAAIAANSDSRYFDLGLCGPLRTDLRDRTEFCGLFRTPTLRNVATRRVFFHNGVFHRLKDVIRFYAERDTQPQKWYPRGAGGAVLKFDDLPARYRANVDMQAPFGRKPGEPSALSDADVEDIEAFLNTLTDGFTSRGAPPAPAARPLRAPAS